MVSHGFIRHSSLDIRHLTLPATPLRSTEHPFGLVEKRLAARIDRFVAEVGKLLELVALLGGQFARHLHRDLHMQVAVTVAMHVANSLAAQAEYAASLRASRNLDLRLPIQGRHLDLAAQRRDG